MLAVFIVAVLGVAFVGLVAFAAMCLAIRNDDKRGLPVRAPSVAAAITRRVLGMTRSRPSPPAANDREPCLAAPAGSDQGTELRGR